jgi:hypothetical protein
MRYEKPQIIDLSRAAAAIHSGQLKVICVCVESKNILNLMTLPAYEADEQYI